MEDKAVLIYFGTMDRLRKLEFILQCMPIILKAAPDTKLLMVGGKRKDIDRLKQEAAILDILNAVIFTGEISRERLFDHILAADISLSPIPPTRTYWFALPTKMIESMGMGCPVIASNIPEQETLIRESGGGISVPYIKENFAEACLELIANPSRVQMMAESGRRYILENFSYQDMTVRLEQLYQTLIRGNENIARQ